MRKFTLTAQRVGGITSRNNLAGFEILKDKDYDEAFALINPEIPILKLEVTVREATKEEIEDFKRKASFGLL